MDSLGKVVILGMIGAMAAVMLKKDQPEWGLLITLAVCGSLLFFIVSAMSGIISFLENILRIGQLSPEVLGPVLKTTGITLVTRLSAEACRDSKETAIAAGIELAGSVLSLYVAMPLLNAVLEMLQSFF